MNLFQYADKMKEIDGIFPMIGMGIVAFLVIIIFWKMLFALRRGFLRQALHTGFVLLAAIVAFILTDNIVPALVNSLNEESLVSLLDTLKENGAAVSEETREILLTVGVDTAIYALALPITVLFSPFIFLSVFAVLNLLFSIAYAIIAAVLHLEKKPLSPPARLGSVMLAAIEGIIVALVIFVPFTNIVAIGEVAIGSIVDSTEVTEDVEEIEEVYDTALIPFIENPAFAFVDFVGGKAITTAFSTVKIHDQKTNLREEVVTATGVIIANAEILSENSFTELTGDAKNAITAIANAITDSAYFSNILTGCVRGVAKAIELGAIDIPVASEYEIFVTDIILFLETLDSSNLKADVDTILSVYFILSDDGVLKALAEGNTESITDILAENRKVGKDTVTKMLRVLQENARTKSLVTSLTTALINTLTSSLGGDSGISYETLKNEVTNVLSVKQENFATKEEYLEELSSTLDEAFKNNNIELESEVVDTIANYIDENYSMVEDLTDEEFNDIILHYFSAYTEYLENNPDGGTPDIEDFPGLEGLPGLDQIPGFGGSDDDGDDESGDGDDSLPTDNVDPDGWAPVEKN